MADLEKRGQSASSEQSMERIELMVPDDLYRAFHRCLWLLVNETGQSQLDIMQEMVRDFLVKHGC